MEGALLTDHLLHFRSLGGSRCRAELVKARNGLRGKGILVFSGTSWVSSRNWGLSLFLSHLFLVMVAGGCLQSSRGQREIGQIKDKLTLYYSLRQAVLGDHQVYIRAV